MGVAPVPPSSSSLQMHRGNTGVSGARFPGLSPGPSSELRMLRGCSQGAEASGRAGAAPADTQMAKQLPGDRAR